MDSIINARYTLFVSQQPMPVEAEGSGPNGSKWFRIKHGCNKSFMLYFNEHNMVIHQGHGCQCRTVYDDVEQAMGVASLPWARADKGQGTMGKLKALIPPPIMPNADDFKIPVGYSSVLVAPTYVHVYRNLNKEIVFWLARYDPPPGIDENKQFRQWFAVDKGNGPEFAINTNKEPVDYPKHMLYGLEHYDPAKPTLFVEGEKAADAAFKLLPKWNILTWCHGKNNFVHCDFSFMKNTQVVMWPDNDEGGCKILPELANKLKFYDITLKAVFDKPTGSFPKKWDLADEPPAGFDIEAWLEKAVPIQSTTQSNEYVQMLNANYRRIQLGRNTDYVDLRPNKAKLGGLFYKITSDRSMYINHPYKIDVPGMKTRQRVIDVWMEQIDTPVLQGIIFDPSTTDPIVGDRLNNFIGFPFEPVKPNRAVHKELAKAYKLFKDLIPDREQRAWVFDYAADIFQNPKRKPPTFLTFVGDQGVGKTLIVEVIRHIIGDEMYCTSTRIDTDERFNDLESGTLLVYQDEVKIGGRGASTLYDRLKNQITQSVKQVERKGMAKTVEASYERRIFTSNHDEPFRIAHDDRRTTIVRISNRHKGDQKAFLPFGAIREQQELAEGVMWFFTKRKIKSNLRQGLMSVEKLHLVKDENNFVNAWAEALYDCELPQWLAELFPRDELDKFGVAQTRMGRAPFIDKISRHFGNEGWLTKSVKARMYECFLWDDVKGRRHEQKAKYIDSFGNLVTPPNNVTIFEFDTWENMRKRFDRVFGARPWPPVRKPSFKLVQGDKPEEHVVSSEEELKKDIL